MNIETGGNLAVSPCVKISTHRFGGLFLLQQPAITGLDILDRILIDSGALP
jgi:hypothetical protein